MPQLKPVPKFLLIATCVSAIVVGGTILVKKFKPEIQKLDVMTQNQENVEKPVLETSNTLEKNQVFLRFQESNTVGQEMPKESVVETKPTQQNVESEASNSNDAFKALANMKKLNKE